ncbi:MAG: hypothetical protein WD825_01275 [Gemmatimonadaceae bacterium]
MQQPPNRAQIAQQIERQVNAALSGAPQTRAELDAVGMRRGELKNQLESITRQRDAIAEQMRTAPDAASARELQSRLKAMDTRSARLEQEILQADDVIAEAVGRIGPDVQRQTSTTVPPPPPNRPIVGLVMLLEGLAFVLLGVVLWRYAWKRAERKFSRPAVDSPSRLDQLQQSVDVIALEVERISEGQRYVAKVLNEKLPAIGAGEAQSIPAQRKSAVPARTADEIE